MEQYTYKICPKFDKPCKDLKIVWVGTEGLIVPCEEAGCLTVSLDPNSAVHCLEFYIFCDECASCPPVYVKRCFCNSDTDCEDCETCNEFGICEPLCKVNEFCDGDKCCECNSTTPCTNGAKCLDCKCVCPQGTFKSNGKCVECDSSTPLTKCQECIDGKIVDKVCDGACDPLTGQCVDCLISGDCYKRTDGKTCCVNKQCVCCAGTVWSASQQRCIPIPCTDESCGPCKRCTESGCVEVVCPDGYKCVNDVCVPWPCKDVSCENGAECGEGCGCIEFEGIKQCVPCYLLNCPGNNSIYPACSGALGCVCNGSNCEGVNHCGQDCDSFNPCTEPGCTCYENKCVNCANFPCTTDAGGCTSYTGCDCPNGTCEGAGCTDKLELIKKQDCTTKNGCELKAELTTKGCKCDPIIFKVQNIATAECNPASVVTPTDPVLTFDVEGDAPATISDILKLKIGLFKKYLGADKQYSKYLTDVAFGDDELVTGSIKVTVEHYYFNNGNILTKADSFTKTVTKAISKNLVAPIPLTANDIKSEITIAGKQVNTYVKILVSVSNVSVVNNSCTQYDSNKQIAEYILDYTTPSNAWDTCNRINTEYQGIFSGKLNDDKSSRKPLFIWSKSNTSTFDTNGAAFNNASGVYSQHGWFRKEYGTKEGNKWIDKINSPEDHENATNGYGELVPNYNYRVMTDCACANNIAFHNELKFCCPNYNGPITECGTKIDLDGFKVCAANGLLSSYQNTVSNPKYLISNINQTTYKLKLTFSDGSTHVETLKHNISDPTFVSGYNKKYTDKSIVAAEVYQSYPAGGLLSDRECVVSLPITEVTVPKVQATTDCLPANASTATIRLSVNLTPGLTIVRTELLRSLNNTPIGSPINSFPSSIQVAKDGVAKKLKFTYSNGCMDEVDVPPCVPTTTPDPQTPTSNLNCPGGVGAAFQALTTGFNQSLPITYSVEGGNLLEPITNTTGAFNNLAAGDYILTAQQEGGLSASSSFTVEDLNAPNIILSPNQVCIGDSATMTFNAEPGTRFNLINPVGAITPVIIGSTGTQSIGNLSLPGTYTAVLTADPTNSYCLNYSEEFILSTGGTVLTPTIEINGTTCVGQPLQFRISGGNGATFIISSNLSGTFGGSVVTSGGQSTLVASNTTFNGTFTPSSQNASISIIGVVGECNSLSSSPITLTLNSTVIKLAPTIVGTPTGACDQLTQTNTVVVTTTGATGVTIGGQAAVQSPSQVWTRTGINASLISGGLPKKVQVVVTNGNTACDITQDVELSDCNCPEGIVTITSTGNTCSSNVATVTYTGDTLGINALEWGYKWQIFDGNSWVDQAVDYTIFSFSPVPTLNVNTDIYEKKVRLAVMNTTNNCTKISNEVSVVALAPPPELVIVPSIFPITSNSNVSFSVPSGNYTYQWGGDASGTSNVSNIRTFAARELPYTVTVNVCRQDLPSCCTTASLSFTVAQSCEPVLQVSAATPQGPCNDILVNVLPSSGTGAKTYTVTSTSLNALNITDAPVPPLGNIVIPTVTIPPGANEIVTVIVKDGNGSECAISNDIDYTRIACLSANYIFLIDNSGSVSVPEFTQMSDQIKFFSQSIYNLNPNSYFATAHYYSTNSSTHFLTPQVLGQNSPITTITRLGVGADYLQESLALFDINDFTGIDPLLPTKLIIFTDATGAFVESSHIFDGGWETNIPTDNILPNIGANYIGGLNALDTYTESDALKLNYEIIVVRYTQSVSGSQNGPYANSQAVTDYMFTQVASPGKMFPVEFNSNAGILTALGAINCTC